MHQPIMQKLMRRFELYGNKIGFITVSMEEYTLYIQSLDDFVKAKYYRDFGGINNVTYRAVPLKVMP